MLAIQDLCFSSLGPINLKINAGQGVSIHGGSGSGKTLLLRAIADLDPHQGNIQLFQNNQSNTAAPAWRKQVGFLGSDVAFWEPTAARHFHEDDKNLLKEYTSQLGITEKTLNQPLTFLSNGEKQRIAIIRLLINRPRALLLDEATSHLDEDSKTKVESLILDYQQQYRCPIIWVSHDKSQRVRIADTHFLMQGGQLSETSA